MNTVFSDYKNKKSEIAEAAKIILENSIDLHNDHTMEILLQNIGDSRYVMLGEATHGTHEYYTWRSNITKRLIEEKGFSFVAVEGDWPDCYRINRYVKGYHDSGIFAKEVLMEFNRWPTWMWANWETVAFAEWLKQFNSKVPLYKRVGFYGLDVYSLMESLETIIKYLDRVDPKAKKAAIKAMNCFEQFDGHEGQSYAQATTDPWVPANCEIEVISLLREVRKKMIHYNTDPEGSLNAEQNAIIAVNAERYYKAMIRGGNKAWNIRDHHMVDTLDRLTKFHGFHSKAIIWAHNTHIGDARATDMSQQGIVNVGQLVNELHSNDGVYSVGFGSYNGTVIASNEWNGEIKAMNVPNAKHGSWEQILHISKDKDILLMMNKNVSEELGSICYGHRAIGVVYDPEFEFGNYVPSKMPLRYDAFIFIDKTKALHPLHITPNGYQMPETYPFGM